MPLTDELERLASRTASLDVQSLQTEEATKHALVLPFVQALGYDVFDPSEVLPEFTADFGRRQGEKVDYAIMDGRQEPIILIECKKASEGLDVHRAQLGRYFPNVNARIGVLTNGFVWQFFSDLDESNRMDTTPFLEVNVMALKNQDFTELERFTKHSFDLDNIRNAATDTRHVSSVKAYLGQMYNQPDESFVRFLANACNYPREGNLTQQRLEIFADFVRAAFRGFVSDHISETLQGAIARHTAVENNDLPIAEADQDDEIPHEGTNRAGGNIVTTVEEQEAYEVVKAALEVWPESYWPGFALRRADVLQSYTA